MQISTQVLKWRLHRHLTQAALAKKSRLARPYLSRLERESVNLTLSSLRRIATALSIRVGQLIDEQPPYRPMTRHEMDELARAAIHPGSIHTRATRPKRVLARVFREKRKALGLYVYRRKKKAKHQITPNVHAARWLRASLGETQWINLLSRIDKLASLLTPKI